MRSGTPKLMPPSTGYGLLSVCSNSEELRLSKMKLKEFSCAKLNQIMENGNCKLRVLGVSENENFLDGDGAEKLAGFLDLCPDIEELRLSGMRLDGGRENLAKLSQQIRQTTDSD